MKRAAKKPATRAKKPVAQPQKQAPVAPVVLPTSRAANLESPSSGDSGWNLSDRGVLGLTFLLAIVAGIAVLLAHVVLKRLRLVQLGRYIGGPAAVDEPEHFEDMQRVLQPWLLTNETNGASGTNGSNGSLDAQTDEDEQLTVATGDGPTRT